MRDRNVSDDHSKTDHTKADSSGTLTAQLYDRLRRDVIMGTLEPGAKLKLEGLSKSYEVSVNTMRETLSRLASDGLVVAEGQDVVGALSFTVVLMVRLRAPAATPLPSPPKKKLACSRACSGSHRWRPSPWRSKSSPT